MNITAEEISRIRAVAEDDKAGADGAAWDKTVTPDVVIALCDKARELEEKRGEALTVAGSRIRRELRVIPKP